MRAKKKPMRRGAKPAKATVKAKRPAGARGLGERLAESLEQQAATAEILRLIGTSPMDAQPVFDGIARSGVRVCGAQGCALFVVDGDMLRVAATHGVPVERVERFRTQFPMPLSAKNHVTQTIHERRNFHLADIEHNPAATPQDIENARLGRYSTRLMVPMLRGDRALGLIAVTTQSPAPFSDQQVALLQTFAAQAVIAIENTRMFTELGAKNSALTESLEQHTATSEILRVISSSPTDVQPVLDAVAEHSVRLCGALFGSVYQFDGELIHLDAHYNYSPLALERSRQVFPTRPTRQFFSARAILERAVVHVPDAQRDDDYAVHDFLRDVGFRSVLSVPMLRDGDPIGAITVWRAEVGPFSDRQVALLKTFADQAVIAVENVRLFKELEARNREVTEALDQKTATSEILGVISSSPTDIQPVFDAIMRSAVRLSGARFGAIYRFDGGMVHFASQHGSDNAALEIYRRLFPMPPQRGVLGARAILDRAVVHVPDVFQDLEYQGKDVARASGWSSAVAVPMLREGTPIGAITISKAETGPFSDGQIALLQTFTDQAVIAIENVRLFTELGARNRELTTALDTQIATSDILRVISRSQTDVQPVFDAIVASAVRLLRAYTGGLTRIAGDQIEVAALTSTDAAADAAVRARYPQLLQSEDPHAQALRHRAPLNIADAHTDPRLPESARAYARVRGHRSWVVVPMLHHDEAIGTIAVTRREPGGFTDDEVVLLETFADQAVIAIENVRLFTELEGRNRDLTATGEILRVISSSPTDVQPVFDTIVRSAVRLCDGLFSALYQFDGELIHQVAQHNFTPEALEEVRRQYPARPIRGLGTGRVILERAVVHMPDVELDPEVQYPALARVVGWRSGLFVPMLREGAPIGVIMVARAEPGPFSDSEIELLKTFADQAVIAVENVRLFKELEARTGELTQSVEKLTALGEVSRAVSSTLDVETVLNTIVSHASQLAGGADCSIYEYDEVAEQFELRATHNDDTEFVEAIRAAPLRKGEGLMGRAAEIREPIQIPDITQPGAYQSSVRDTLIRFGYRALLAVPLLREDQIIGSLSFNRKAPGEFPPEVVDVLKTFATQSALAIQNARLFREIADKSRQLEVASQHKSEFLANMSHELRTPLNAIIGFSEVLNERMFGELNDKQAEYLKDIHASGQHLLSLINDILDLSKVEAGRMELELTDFDLPAAMDNAVTLVRERASRKGITVRIAVAPELGAMRGDERKIRQVLLNLLSNAIKFTPEGGRIEVAAVPNGGSVEVSVRDTGVGIAPADHEAVFEEFRQVGAADKKAEGTGLGLALARKFIELHGGRIWVTSQVGAGSTFTFTLPLQRPSGA